MESLIADLKTLLDERKEGYVEAVRSRLAKYQQSGDTEYKKYQFFNKFKYCRNLIAINPEFELILLCWAEGQASPIHNHASQDCWFAVMEGGAEEIYYYYDEQTKKITQGDSHKHAVGVVGHIRDEVALHVVRPFAGMSACTLHVYSKPIAVCKIYCVETGIRPHTCQVTERASGFYTVFGKKFEQGDSNIYRDLYAQIRGSQVEKLTPDTMPCGSSAINA